MLTPLVLALCLPALYATGCRPAAGHCARKCCEADEAVLNDECVPTELPLSNFMLYNFTSTDKRKAKKLRFEHGKECADGFFRIKFEGEFYLQYNGSLYGSDAGDEYVMYPPERYCLDYDLGEDLNLIGYICVKADAEMDSVDIAKATGRFWKA